MIAFAQIGLWIYGIDSHIPHNSADSFAVDQKPVIPPDYTCDCPVAPCGMSRVDLIDSPHEEQLLIGDGSLFRRLAVYAASVDIKKLGLPSDIDSRVAEINAVFSSSQVRGVDQIFF